MNTTTITEKGQITVPKEVRNFLNLKAGDKVLIKIEDDKVFIKKIPSIFELQGSVRVPEEVRNLDWKDIEKKAHVYIAEKNAKIIKRNN